MIADKLENAVRNVEYGRAAILMGFDGIPVDSFNLEADTDIETVGMELSVVLKEVRKAAEMLEAGVTEEVIIRTDQLSTVLRIVNGSYFLAMAMGPKGSVGKARYLLRLLAPEISSSELFS